MPRENVDAGSVRLTPFPPDLVDGLRHSYGLWNEGGPGAMAREVWHPDIVWHDPPDWPDSAVHRGADAVLRHMSRRIEAAAFVVTLENAWWVREGEMALVELSLHMDAPSSGMGFDVPLFHLLRVVLAEWRVLEVWEYSHRAQALEAVAQEQ